VRLFSKLKSVFGRFKRDQRASMSIVAALSAIPLIVAGGAAIDLERAINARTALRASLDSAALYAASLTDTNNATLTTKAQPYMTANYHNSSEGVVNNFKIVLTGKTVVATADVSLNTVFMSLIGTNTIDISQSSTVVKQGAKLEVAVVLDNSGSMNDAGKMTALRGATSSLITQLQGIATSPQDVFVAMVAFDDAVNIGTSSVPAASIDWSDYGTCTIGRRGGNAGITQATCGGTWTPHTVAQRSSWNGCVTDRGDVAAVSSGNYDINAVAPVSTIAASKFPAVDYTTSGYNYCPQASMGLSTNWSGMQTFASNMTPLASTNQNIGLVHGWMALNGVGPFTTPALDPNATYKKALILLSDGLNTVNRWTYGYSNPIDTRQALACQAMKNEGIILYTVQVNTAGDPTSTVLQGCASDASKFFQVTQASDINAVLNAIGTNLASIHISR